jgi:hypothetical protein
VIFVLFVAKFLVLDLESSHKEHKDHKDDKGEFAP